jgi:DNA polymerase-3 subunit alpha
VHEARRKGAIIHPPSIQKSSALTIIQGRDIFLGLGMIKDLEHPLIERLLLARKNNGPFKDFEDFLDRVRIGVEQCTLLIRVGAFRFLGQSKKQLLWKAQL